MAAPTSAAAFCGLILPVSSPISVIATTSGSAVAERSTIGSICARERSRR